ncbi:MAG: sulfatase-like hydrolase/transferase [Myxococcales bacterium]|nr:sulfatase-like hydrolase/transferase [Polyangiaceae bacterium]MDW8251313.1 sulfatase-like hydrolase/transferase [Myxococcales bacterium]
MAKVTSILGGILGVVGVLGCCSPQDGPSQANRLNSREPVLQEREKSRRSIDLIEMLPRCEVRHRGIFLDLGTPSVDSLAGWRLGPEPNPSVEREGANWLQVSSHTLTYRFVLQEPQSIFFSARIKSLSGKHVALFLDGKGAGFLPVTRGQSRVSSSAVLSTPVAAGSHTLTLRFAGASREQAGPLAEVDWIRVGFSDEDPSLFAAPTHGDVLQNLASLGDQAHRPLALRVPSTLRCFLAIPGNARFQASLALLGSGEGEVEVRLWEEDQPVQVLKTSRVLGSEKPMWTELDLPLHDHGGKLATLEVNASHGGPGSRLLLGDPRILRGGAPASRVPRARAVVVVVVSSLNPERLPPWAPERPLPTFDALAREGVIFERYRVPSSVVGAVMASLMTGLTPRQHTVEDGFTRIPETLPTLATLARDASVLTAMFSVHPATSGAFGFARGWDRFVFHSPVSPALGTRPIEDLISWLGERGARAPKGLLAVVHTRGIHPPFDYTPGEFAQLPPHPEQEYSGVLDPRRAGQTLERLRRKKKGSPQRWSDVDNVRLNAAMDGALIQTDRSLSNLIDALRKNGLWKDTLLVVTSDVAGATDPSVLPFASVQELTEEVLRVPLYVRFPGGGHGGERVQVPVSTMDLTATVLLALGLDAAVPVGGEDLFAQVEQGGFPTERAQVASLGEKVAVRWGNWRLVARDGVAPHLCEVTVDPRCEHNRAERMPELTQALWRQAYEYEQQGRPPAFQRPKREPATLDPETSAALNVWGN